MVLSNRNKPTALLVSRQKLPYAPKADLGEISSGANVLSEPSDVGIKKKTQAVIIATGPAVERALKAQALLAGLGAGFAVGALNAFLVTLVGIPSLIATLATGSILFGVNFLLTGGRAIYGGLPESFLWLGQGRVLGVPVLAFFMIGAVALAWFVMERTIFGRYIYAVGGNQKACLLYTSRCV